MPEFDDATRDKIVLLRGLRTLGTPPEGPFEIVKIEWPSPDGTKYYGTTDVASVASVAPDVDVELRLIPENETNSFLPVTIDSTIGDEDVDLKFWDADDVISDLLVDHGEGLRVTLLYWFPQVELLLPVWEGHLRAEDEADLTQVTLKAVQGFRSGEGSLPSRGHYAFCQAPFGGIFTTQEEIDEGGCDYNRQILGGTVGTLNPSTGLPWTFCPRRDTFDCITRGVNPLRHLSHRTITRTTVNVQSSGARLLSTSQGNETNLTEPVRVIMGTRRAHDMKVMVFRKDLNNNTPDHGWYVAFYEGCEGPIASMTQCRVHVGPLDQPANPATGFSVRLGNFGDASPDVSLSPHGFSATAFFRDTTGWLNPASINPEDANGSALISGLRDIRVYRQVVADANGVLAVYYSGYDFDSEFGRRVENQIYYPWPGSTLPPVEGLPNTNWSIKYQFRIKPRYTETYTFKIRHDDGVKLIIDGVDVIDSLTVNGTHTGTAALEADRPYDVELWFKQGVSVWYLEFYWRSASQAEEIVPYARLFLANDESALYLKQPTSNRVWQIARMMCDKRWGVGYDYAKLNIDSWIAAAEWVEQFVRFIDPLGNIWDHQRGMSDVELIERKIQQQIEDMCLSGRLSRPFLFDGEIHILPLRALTDDELDACPEFTDEGESPNIIQEEIKDGVWKSTLKWSRKSDLDLPNRIECTYDSAADDYVKTPLQPVEDIDLQLRAGRILGDNTKKVNTKKYHLLGVTGEAHGMKLQWSLLDLGPHEEGGLQNNVKLTFKIWFLDALDLHIAKVIKVTNAKLQAKYGFTHFRILKLEREDDLHYVMDVQAYNHAYMVAFETLFEDLPVPPKQPPVTTPPKPFVPVPATDPPQCVLDFGSITYDGTTLDIPVPECAGETAVLDGGAPDTIYANPTDAGNSSQTFLSGYDGGGA
jgi:hypothetical protein